MVDLRVSSLDLVPRDFSLPPFGPLGTALTFPHKVTYKPGGGGGGGGPPDFK